MYESMCRRADALPLHAPAADPATTARHQSSASAVSLTASARAPVFRVPPPRVPQLNRQLLLELLLLRGIVGCYLSVCCRQLIGRICEGSRHHPGTWRRGTEGDIVVGDSKRFWRLSLSLVYVLLDIRYSDRIFATMCDPI